MNFQTPIINFYWPEMLVVKAASFQLVLMATRIRLRNLLNLFELLRNLNLLFTGLDPSDLVIEKQGTFGTIGGQPDSTTSTSAL